MQFVRDSKKRRADARLKLQRVAHEAWGSAKELWVSERAMQLLTIWHRYAVFRTCKRADQGMPLFAEHVEKWTQFVTAYEDRKLREAAANRLYPLVRCPLQESVGGDARAATYVRHGWGVWVYSPLCTLILYMYGGVWEGC